MKNTFKIIITLIISLSIISCGENGDDITNDIKIGKEKESISEVHLNKQTERAFVLSGGNGKYYANIADSKIAQISVSNDTLRVKGILEGETFATIISHDKKANLKIKVNYPELSFSQNEVRLYPKDEAKFISLSGGGDIVDLKVEDLDNILDYKWNGNTGIIEIKPYYEGEVTITAISQDGKKKSLKVKVRAEGEVKDIGVYATVSKSIYKEINTGVVIKRKNIGTWIYSTPNIYHHKTSGVRVSPIINPKQGEKINVEVETFPRNAFTRIKDATYTMYVEEVRPNNRTVVLRGRGFKFVLPY